MFQARKTLFSSSRRIFQHYVELTRSFNIMRDEFIAPKLHVVEAIKERIIEAGGFSEAFKHHTAMSIIFQGYGTNASLLHAMIELGVSPKLMYIGTKPHTTDDNVRKYLKTMGRLLGLRYIDFSDYTYEFTKFGFTQHFSPGTYPAGFYDEAMRQYYEKFIEIQRTELLQRRPHPKKINQLALFDEGGKFHLVFDRVKNLYFHNGYKIAALGHSTSDLIGEQNNLLNFPKISMGGAAIKSIIEAEEISHANLLRLEAELSKFSKASRKEIRFGVLGCGNIGSSAITALLARGDYIVYFDHHSGQYANLNALQLKHPTQLIQANNQQDLFNRSDVILSCAGNDVTMNLDYRTLVCRPNSPLKEKLAFNFASGEKEFGHWLRQSQNKDYPRIVNPQKKIFPDCELFIAHGKKLIIRFSGMPANMMLRDVHGLPIEKAQLIRGMKLFGAYQLDKLLQLKALYKETFFNYYLKLDQWWQRLTLEQYANDMIKLFPETASYYNHLLERLVIAEIERISHGKTQPKEEPYTERQCMDSLPPNPFYVARKHMVSQINNCFLQPTPHGLRFVLHGIAGIGKTQIAQHYYINHAQHYALAFYFYAEDRQALIQQYQVKLRQYKQQIFFGSEQEIIHDFKTWVEQHPSALLVYDNVENHDMLDSLVPNLKRLRILITSRREFGIGAEVTSMTEQEAHDLLLGILRHQTYKDNDIDQISSLIKELHYFPLAIAQAGAIITDDESIITISQFLDDFRNNRLTFLTSKKKLTWGSASHESVYITWLMIKKKLQRKLLPWKSVLNAISLLPAEEFSKSLIEEQSTKYIELIYDSHDLLDCILSVTFLSIAMFPPLYIFTLFYGNDFNGVNIIFNVCWFSIIQYYLTIKYNKYLEKEIHAISIKLTSQLINFIKLKIPETINYLVKFGIISKIGNGHYTIHRLVQEILLAEFLKKNDLKKLILEMDTLNIQIKFFYGDTHKNKADITYIANIGNQLLKARHEICLIIKEKNNRKYSIADEIFFSGPSNDHIFYGPSRLNGVKFFIEVAEKYINLSFSLMKILVDLRRLEESDLIRRNVVEFIYLFYNSLVISDKVIFFDYVHNLNKFINQFSGENLSSLKRMLSIKIEDLPTFKDNRNLMLTEFKVDLEKYICEKEKDSTHGFTSYYYIYVNREKIKRAR